MKGNADEYAKKAKQRFGKQDPLQDIDEEALKPERPQPEMPQRGGQQESEERVRRERERGQQEVLDDAMSEDRWDT